jgi:hypothetical protein
VVATPDVPWAGAALSTVRPARNMAAAAVPRLRMGMSSFRTGTGGNAPAPIELVTE